MSVYEITFISSGFRQYDTQEADHISIALMKFMIDNQGVDIIKIKEI